MNKLISKIPFDKDIISGGFWSAALNATDRIVWLIRTVVLARLLAPDAFGTMGLCLICLDSMRKIVYFGLDEALIGNKDDNIDKYLDTVWTVKIIRGGFVLIVVTLLASRASRFFSEPLVSQLLPLVGLAYFLHDSINPSVIYFRKNIKFRKQFLYVMVGSVVGIVVAIFLAFEFDNASALVGGLLSRRASQLVMSFLITDYSPSFGINSNLLKSLLSYGRWIHATAIVSFLANSGDDLFIGWLLTSAALGYYRVGFQLSNAPATELSQTINNVMFPAFSRIQDDLDKVRESFIDTLGLISVLVMPASFGIISIAPEFTILVFGEQWESMIVPMQILAISGLFRSIAKTSSSVFRGIGKPNWGFHMNLVRTVVIAISIYPLTNSFGISGVAISITSGMISTLPFQFYGLQESIGLEVGQLLPDLLFPLISSITMATIVLIIVQPTYISVIFSIFAGAIIYISLLFVSSRILGYSLFSNLPNG